DLLRRRRERLNRGRAGARDAERVDVLRQARAQNDLARDVQPVERRHDLAVDAQGDLLRRDLRALDQLLDDGGAEVDGPEVLERGPRLGEWGPQPGDDGDAVAVSVSVAFAHGEGNKGDDASCQAPALKFLVPNSWAPTDPT